VVVVTGAGGATTAVNSSSLATPTTLVFTASGCTAYPLAGVPRPTPDCRREAAVGCVLAGQGSFRGPSGGGCGIRTHDDGHPPYRFSRPAHSATMRTLQAAAPEDRCGLPIVENSAPADPVPRTPCGQRQIECRLAGCDGKVWPKTERGGRSSASDTEVRAMSRSSEDMASTVRSSR
jgi:hypothetical protein